MNRSARREFLAPVDTIVDKIVKDMHTWKERFGACGAFLSEMFGYAQQRGVSREEVMNEIGGELACRLIKRLGSPPITEAAQYLAYLCSNSLTHKAAAVTWGRQHQDELMALQREFSNLPIMEEFKSAERRIQTIN